MRVITGTARGHKLIAPPGEATRPTADMTKEALFSMIQFEVEGAAVLDLFAGSGQLGIEALSRGARLAVFIDHAREARTVILENLAATGLMGRARVSMMDAKSFLSGNKEQFDLAFLDPPYDSGTLLEELLPLVAAHMHPAGIILCETGRAQTLPDIAGSFVRKRDYRYGKAKLTTYRHREEMPE